MNIFYTKFSIYSSIFNKIIMEVYNGTRKNEIFRKFGWKNPMLELVFDYKGEEKRIFVKNESYNLTGSIKDRMAFYTLKKAYEKGEIKKGAAL